jgi:hypothetical protein
VDLVQSEAVSVMATRAAFVDDGVVGGECGGERLQGEVVDRAGVTAGNVVDQRDRVVGEQLSDRKNRSSLPPPWGRPGAECTRDTPTFAQARNSHASTKAEPLST